MLRGEHLQRACAEEREQRRFLLHLSSGRLQRAGSSLDAELRQRRHRQYLRSRTCLRRTNSTLRLSLLHYIPLTLAFFSPCQTILYVKALFVIYLSVSIIMSLLYFLRSCLYSVACEIH